MHSHMPGLRRNARMEVSSLSTLCALGAAAVILTPSASRAGVTNPDISALGQVIGGYTDDKTSPDADHASLKSGEMEMVLDAYLNPFIKGWFTISGGEDGFNLEEGYASVVKGLPWGLNLKAGKYRLGFGKLNPAHPHAYPFITSPRSVQSLLFGPEGFNETGAQVSALLPTPGDWASTLSGDVIEGKSFHEGRGDGTRLGALGRWANDFLLGETGALETGVSGATGVDSVGPDTHAYLAGADVKAKFYLPSSSQLTVQAEAILKRSHVSDTVAHTFDAEDRLGFYGFFDYRYHTQWNGGLLYEQYEREGETSKVDQAFRVFAGYAVLEESTLIRLMYERFLPDGGDAVNSVSLQLLFSMGPHKAHQF